MSNTPFVSSPTFNRGKTVFVLFFVCLFFIAASLRAEDDRPQSSDPDGVSQKTPDDLSPHDKAVARDLQNQIDKENKAADDKAKREYEKLHSSGGDGVGLIIPALIVLIVAGLSVYSKSKAAFYAIAACCVAVIVFGAILLLTEKPSPSVPSITQQADVAAPGAQETAGAAKAAKAELAVSLKKELAASKDEVAKKIQRLNYVKQQVTFSGQAYQTDVQDTAAKTDVIEKMNCQDRDSKANALYQSWLDDYQKESDELAQQRKHVLELQADLFQITGLIDSDGIDPSTGLPAIGPK